jgi:hypothetical protein
VITQKDLIQIIFKWAPFAFIATVMSGLIFVAVQQDMRTGANDPQIQLAENAASQLKSGIPANVLVPSSKLDPSTDLSPFVIVYDKSGNVIASQAMIKGKTPNLPSDVFKLAPLEWRFTWQPQSGVRIAAVVTSYQGPNSGYVLAGRSLKEVEVRESNLQFEIEAFWILSLLGSLALIGVLIWVGRWINEKG